MLVGFAVGRFSAFGFDFRVWLGVFRVLCVLGFGYFMGMHWFPVVS